MNMRFRYGSHLPVLIKLVSMTSGPIVEFGGGVNSTIFLHWACHNTGRKLLTLESEWEYHKQFRSLRCEYHSLEHVRKWTDELARGKWSIVLIDHHPKEKGVNASALRAHDANRFTDAEYVVMHDSDHYDYSSVYPHFKYRYEYKKSSPHTVVLSNINDVSEVLL
jgi:hypothetical protein